MRSTAPKDRPGSSLGAWVGRRVAQPAQATSRGAYGDRAHVEALARDAPWGCDSTLVGRSEHGEFHALVVRDLFVPSTPSIGVGGEPRGVNVVRQFELTAKARGSWPVEIAFDNGGANSAELV